jgi:hypothetical protein
VSIKQSGIVHRYDRLEPEERFRAALEAAARDDNEEYDRLWDTCPMRHYSMTDAAFTDRWRASSTLAIAVAIDLGPRLANLRMLAATRETLPHAVALGVDVGTEDFEELTPEDVADIVAETMGKAFDKAEEHLRSQAAAVHEAFARVCREEMGVEPKTVLKATLGPLYLDMLGLDQLDGAEPDREALAAWREMFGRKWRKRVGGWLTCGN